MIMVRGLMLLRGAACGAACAGAAMAAGLGLSAAYADVHELATDAELNAFAEEISGVAAKRNLEAVSQHHRTRASRPYRAAADFVLTQLHSYGFDNAEILEFPADGETLFGTQMSRLAWNVDAAELWELRADDSDADDGDWTRARRLGDWASMPLSVAQDSFSGDVEAELVDVGSGLTREDYDGANVRGRLVLTSSQPGAIADMAVGEFGAAGIISYAQNQRSAWWGEDERLVRWGHLGSFPSVETFAFMISPGEARALQARLAAGEAIRLEAKVEATHEVGVYALVTAVIEGSDPAVRDEEIVFTCHLDHPRPGANDNASGCVAILEAARAMKALIDEGRLAPPRRSIRFLWPPEIEGSIIYLAGRPDLAAQARANIHMDMVGGGPVTKAVFRISGGPMSAPSFIADVAHDVGAYVNAQTEIHASGGVAVHPLVSPEGGREPLLALMEGIDLGSDHQVFNEGSWRIPGIYLHDWPDRYIHTNFDMPGNIDPTKLKRAAFIGAVTAWVLADMDASDAAPVLDLLRHNTLRRAGDMRERAAQLEPDDAAALARVHWAVERAKVASLDDFAPLTDEQRSAAEAFLVDVSALFGDVAPAPQPQGVGAGVGAVVYQRNPDIMGPMNAFGFSYLTDRLGADRVSALALPAHSVTDREGRVHGGGKFAYEALNFVDGVRSVQGVRDWLTAELGPVPVEMVAEYLSALEEIEVLQRAP